MKKVFQIATAIFFAAACTERTVSLSDDPEVKYYSGSALYTNAFTLEDKDIQDACVTLNLGEAMVIASVKVNGKDAGGSWTFPYRPDIGSLVKEGANTLEVRVWNNWCNRLISDERLAPEKRLTWTNIQPWKAGDELQSSGLLGPVKVIVEKKQREVK